jgi:hypothetical protein
MIHVNLITAKLRKNLGRTLQRWRRRGANIRTTCRRASASLQRGSRRLTTAEFITKAHAVHGDKYLYDKTVYVRTNEKAIITCPEHNDFLQRPTNHLCGDGCRACRNNKFRLERTGVGTKGPNEIMFQDTQITILILERNDGSVYEAALDTKDYPLVAPFRWYPFTRPRGEGFYAVTTEQTRQFMHVLIMGGKGYDHKDRNGLNNRRDNLRAASICQNMMNRGKIRRPCSSKYIGVHHRDSGKWQAHIQANRKSRHIGTFDSEIAAARARDTVARELHGEFAVLNFPDVAIGASA